MCYCYNCKWNQPYVTNSGYWHKCVCFTCRKVGSRGEHLTELDSEGKPKYRQIGKIEKWPRCSRCNQNMVMCGAQFKAPKYKDKKQWKYLQNNWTACAHRSSKGRSTIDNLKKYKKNVEKLDSKTFAATLDEGVDWYGDLDRTPKLDGSLV